MIKVYLKTDERTAIIDNIKLKFMSRENAFKREGFTDHDMKRFVESSPKLESDLGQAESIRDAELNDRVLTKDCGGSKFLLKQIHGSTPYLDNKIEQQEEESKEKTQEQLDSEWRKSKNWGARSFLDATPESYCKPHRDKYLRTYWEPRTQREYYPDPENPTSHFCYYLDGRRKKAHQANKKHLRIAMRGLPLDSNNRTLKLLLKVEQEIKDNIDQEDPDAENTYVRKDRNGKWDRVRKRTPSNEMVKPINENKPKKKIRKLRLI
jgi:hypothetical protein